MADAARPGPQDISQALLDKTGRAYFEDDFETFATCFLLPQHVATHDGSRHLRDRADLRALYQSMRALFAARGATWLDRRCIAAEYADDDTVRATHESRLLAGDTVIQTGFPAFSILKRHEGVWKVAFSQYAVPDTEHARALGTLPSGSDNPSNGDSE